MHTKATPTYHVQRVHTSEKGRDFFVRPLLSFKILGLYNIKMNIIQDKQFIFLIKLNYTLMLLK